METVISGLVDEFPVLGKGKWRKTIFTGILCFGMFLMGLPMVTPVSKIEKQLPISHADGPALHYVAGGRGGRSNRSFCASWSHSKEHILLATVGADLRRMVQNYMFMAVLNNLVSVAKTQDKHLHKGWFDIK